LKIHSPQNGQIFAARGKFSMKTRRGGKQYGRSPSAGGGDGNFPDATKDQAGSATKPAAFELSALPNSPG
jgi:hypothetical protein